MLTRSERLLAPASVVTLSSGFVAVSLDVKTAELEKAFATMRDLWLASCAYEWQPKLDDRVHCIDWKFDLALARDRALDNTAGLYGLTRMGDI